MKRVCREGGDAPRACAEERGKGAGLASSGVLAGKSVFELCIPAHLE